MGKDQVKQDSQEAVQEEVFVFLADPGTHSGATVRRIDTHGAAVFLAGKRVFKVKRAVKFPFMDYSTLAKRKAACEAEVAVNLPFAPDIYAGVRAIVRQPDGSVGFGPDGKPIEYAVEMVRFDEEQTLDRIAARDGIDDALADALGRAVAAGHAQAKPVDAPPWIAALADYIEQNDDAFCEMPNLFDAAKVEALTQASRAAHARLVPLLTARGKDGLVRRGHGDLHLGNIAVIDGKPMLFDAIEFDPLVASGDVLYDLAFPLMDLVERGLKQAANIVLNRYLAETGRDSDLDALAALPLFLSLRAAIRAKVMVAREKPAEDEARKYFDLACALIEPPAPRLVAVGGLSGTGKSVLTRMLAPLIAPAPGAALLRSDVMRKRMFDKPETEKLPPHAYTPEVTARIYADLAAKARRVIAAGHSAVVDAVFARANERTAIEGAAGLFLTADLATRVARVGKRVGDASDADAAVAKAQEDYDLGHLCWTEVDASGTPEQTLANAKAALGL